MSRFVITVDVSPGGRMIDVMLPQSFSAPLGAMPAIREIIQRAIGHLNQGQQLNRLTLEDSQGRIWFESVGEK